MGILSYFKRHENVRVLLIGKNASHWVFKNLIKEGEYVKDLMTDKAYGPIGRFRPFYDLKGKPTYLFNEETGAPLQAELDREVLRLTTDPALMARLTAKEMLSNALKREPSFGFVILVAVAALSVGITLGAQYFAG